jgi:peroxiredoxin
MPNQGEKAPTFTLPDTERKQRSLQELLNPKGTTILAFYPGAFTGVCTKEMCTLRVSLTQFNNINAKVVGISVNDPFSNKAFAEKNNVNFPLLSDFNRDVVRQYNIALNDFAGLKGYTAAKRSVFILDSRGNVIYRWVSDDPGKEPNYDEVRRAAEKTSPVQTAAH